MKLPRGEQVGDIPSADDKLSIRSSDILKEFVALCKAYNACTEIRGCNCGFDKTSLSELERVCKKSDIIYIDVFYNVILGLICTDKSYTCRHLLAQKSIFDRAFRFFDSIIGKKYHQLLQSMRRDRGITFWQELKAWFRPSYWWFTVCSIWIREIICWIGATIISLIVIYIAFGIMHCLLFYISKLMFSIIITNDTTVITGLFLFVCAYFSFFTKKIYPYLLKTITFLVEKEKFREWYPIIKAIKKK